MTTVFSDLTCIVLFYSLSLLLCSLDNVDAAEMIQKEKLARQLATRLASIARPSDCPLFEHFLVFGQSNRKMDDVKPTCIFQYPAYKPVLLQALEQFVFPAGMPPDRDLSRVSTSVLDFHSSNPQNSFALLLTTSIKEVFYAICVVDEYLKPYPTFVPAPDDPKEPLHAKLTWSTRCYCLVTRYPLFDLMFDVLLHLLDVEEKSLTLPPAHRSGDLNQVNRILAHLWTVPAPAPGGSINLGIPRIPTYMRPAQHEDESLISAHCVPTLFWALDKDSILTLVSAALLERKLIFVSPNLRLLTNCILSFVALLKPFVLQCVFIPVLPDNLLQIAEAPVPFIAGLANPKLTRTAKEANPEIIIVDLTARRLYIPPESAVPPLPNIRSLSHAIDPYVVQLRKTFDKHTPPYKAVKSQRDFVTEMLRLLEQYITPYFEAFRRHCVTSLTDNVTIFVKETYLIEETDATSIDFFQPFLETQVFSYWCDQKLKEIDRQRQKKYATPVAQRPQQAALAPAAQLVRPASTDDLSSLASYGLTSSSSSTSSSLNHHNILTMPSPTHLTAMGLIQKGMGSSITRPRSSSSNDEFVASLQFNLTEETDAPILKNESTSQSTEDLSPPSSSSLTTKRPLASSTSTTNPTITSTSTTPILSTPARSSSLSLPDPKGLVRPKSALLTPVKED